MTSKKIKTALVAALPLLLILLLTALVSAQVVRGGVYVPWPSPAEQAGELCEPGQDFVVQIPPGGCEPAIVRSDLLEEQNVPVFCKLVGVKINPLIEVPRIRSVYPSWKGHENIVNIAFFPPRVALSSTFAELLGSPLWNNLGYLVVVIKRQPVEEKMPEWIEANLTARILYDFTRSFGINLNELILKELSDAEWQVEHKEADFWNGRGYARALSIEPKRAQIGIYIDPASYPITSVWLREGETSSPIYMPGFYCSGGLTVKLNKLEFPQTKAELIINGNKRIVTEGVKTLDGNCRVSRITPSPYGYGGSVLLDCPEADYELLLEDSRARIKVDKTEDWYSIGDNISVMKDKKETNLYLAWAGKVLIAKEPFDFAVLIEAKERGTGVITRIRKKVDDFLRVTDTTKLRGPGFRDKLQKALAAKDFISSLMGLLRLKIKPNVWIISKASSKIYDKKISLEEVQGLIQAKHPDIIEHYYKKSIDAYKEVSANWPLTRDKPNGTYFGAQALLEAAQKALFLNKSLEAAKLFNDLIERYPDEAITEQAKEELSRISRLTDTSKAEASIVTAGRSYYVVMNNIMKPKPEEQNVKLSIAGTPTKTFFLDDLILEEEWQITEISEERVIFKNVNITSTAYGKTVSIRKGRKELLSQKEVLVTEINLKRLAYVTIKPFSREGVTLANFTFKVGIERRVISLSPEQTREAIEKLNRTITEWEKIIEKLGNYVSTWKKICFAGSAVLWVKNFIENLSGKALARKLAMRGDPRLGLTGWTKICEQLVAKEPDQYKSISDCLYQKGTEIDKTIDYYQDTIDAWNKLAEDVKEKPGVMRPAKKLWGLISSGKVVDNEEFLKQLSQHPDFFEKYGKLIKTTIDEKEFTAGDIMKNFTDLRFTKTEAREFFTRLALIEKCREERINEIMCKDLEEAAKNKLDSYARALAGEERVHKAMADFDKLGISLNMLPSYEREKKIKVTTELQTLTKSKLEKIDPNRKNTPHLGDKAIAGFFEFERVPYMAVLEFFGGNEYKIRELYELDEETKKVVKKLEKKDIPKEISYYITAYEPGMCDNPYKGKLEVRFWETEPYIGLPALMPIDVKEGWYAATKAAGAGLVAYAESGKLRNFWICNVGKDGMPDFDFNLGPKGDDAQYCCLQVPLFEVPEKLKLVLNGLSQERTARLIAKASRCMEVAAQQFKRGAKKIVTDCGTFDKGDAAVTAPTLQCEDFMSPGDCRLLFNLCDPVICPRTRCNMGGRYTVSDVVQTGIIGGIALCLPNIEEGILVPVCLTGIHAGLDNFVSVLKAVKACLEENLATGKNVGICDELKSVYLCEFFWRQLAPFLKVGIPSLIESIFYGGKGGGEYLKFNAAWDSALQSVEYFTEYYGVNAIKAFQARTTAVAGSQLCRAFVSLAYPNQVDLLDELAKPESPYQINAWFDEIPLTTATVPAQSHYKIFWHIFAGRDKSRYYRIYLQQPPLPAYYRTSPTYFVAAGYIPLGEYVDITKDIIAPAGYKELCVQVDLEPPHCGFKKVTTAFATEELAGLYTADQAAKEVSTEEECISGSPSLVPLALGPNIQASVEEAIQPALWKRGITRICASQNPGRGVDEARWSRIGSCDPAEQIGCWLNLNSVKGAIEDTGLQKQVLEKAKDISNEILRAPGYMSEEASKTALDKKDKEEEAALRIVKGIIKKWEGEEDITEQIEALIEKPIELATNITKLSINERYRAKAQLEIAALYNNITELLYRKWAPPTPPPKPPLKVPSEPPVVPPVKPEEVVPKNIIIYHKEKGEISKDVIFKFYSLIWKKAPTEQIYKAWQERLKEIDEKIKIKLGTREARTFGELPSDCDKCGKGLINLCDEAECHIINLKIEKSGGGYEAWPTSCYFKPGGFLRSAKCFSCSEAKRCIDLNSDPKQCENEVCSKFTTEKICKHDEKYCLPADVAEEYSKLRKKEPIDITDYLDFIDKYTLSAEATKAAEYVWNIINKYEVENKFNEVKRYLSKLSAYVDSENKKLAEIAKIAKDELEAIEAFDHLVERAVKCKNSKNTNCKCEELDMAKMIKGLAANYQIYSFTIKLEQDKIKLLQLKRVIKESKIPSFCALNKVIDRDKFEEVYNSDLPKYIKYEEALDCTSDFALTGITDLALSIFEGQGIGKLSKNALFKFEDKMVFISAIPEFVPQDVVIKLKRC